LAQSFWNILEERIMSLRSFGDAKGRKGNGKNSAKIKGRLASASLSAMEPLEKRQLLNASVVPNGGTVTGVQANPLAPFPGKSFWVNGNGTSNAWTNASAITPYTVNDLVLNVTPFTQSYTACCEASNSAPGNSGSVNSARMMTNGIIQNQVGGFPASGQVAATGDGTASDPSNGQNVVSQNGGSWFLEYNLGAWPGGSPAGNGYDISEIDVLTGHQDTRTGMQDDIQVQFLNGNTTDWFSLSNNANFNFTTDGSAQLSRGSAQMAIVNFPGGGAMAQNVVRVKFVANNQQTWFRELVVTGTASNSPPALPPSLGAPVAAPTATPGQINVTFPLGSPASSIFSYSIQRAVVTNGTPGAFTTVGGTVTFVAPGTFVDNNTAAGTTYVYRVIGSNPNGSITSGNSNFIATPPIAVEAHYYNMGYWEGPVTLNQGLAIMSASNGGSWGAGIRGSQDSAVFTGKITTNASGVYTFFSNTDDDGYLYINGALVSFDPGGHGQRDAGTQVDINGNPLGTFIPIQLAANTSYDFVLLEHNSGGGAGANIDWVTPSAPSSRLLLPAANLSSQASHPATPTGLATTQINANFVNFTFTANNSAVVHYILQRAIAGTTNWVTVDQIDPASNQRTLNAVSTGFISVTNPTTVTIQDAEPIPGVSYIYRVGAVNFDGAAYSPTTQATLTPIADLLGTPSGTPQLTAATDALTPPNAAASVGSTADATGLPAGTYFVKYTWANNLNGETQSSAEQSIIVASASDVTVGLPAAPFGSFNGNVFISTVSGAEKFSGTVAGGATLTIKTLPVFAARSAPASSLATITTTADGTSSLTANTYFVDYVWRNSAGQLTAASLEQTVTLTATGSITVQTPSAVTGASNANVYIGTVSGGEKLAGTTAGNTVVIKSLPGTAAVAPPVTNAAGLTPGTYFVKYTWVDNFSNQSGSTPESTIVLTQPLSDIRVGAPEPSNSGAKFNTYISTSTGTELLQGSTNRGSTAVVQALPATNAAAVPATPLAVFGTAADATGLPAGTYFVKYTWLNSVGGETAATFEQSFVTAGTGDITVTLPTAPAGAVNANVYISSVSGGERLAASTVNTTQVSTIRGLPFSLATAAPTNSSVGLPAATYFVAYTWVGDNTTTSGESSADIIDPNSHVVTSNEKSIVLAQTADITISAFGSVPAGVGSVNVYIGTSSGGERLVGNIPTNGSITVKALPASTQPGLPTSLNNQTVPVSSQLAVQVPAETGNPAGAMIRIYNQEMFRRLSDSGGILASTNTQSLYAIPRNGLATEYVAQTVAQTYSTFLPGVIDRDFGAINPSNPVGPPQSPDATLFPDIKRIHTESFAEVFTGKITTAQSGIYTIISNTDDDGWAWLNGLLVSADPGGHGQQDASAVARSQDTVTPVFLSAGNTYDMVMFSGQTGGGSGAHLSWVLPSKLADATNSPTAASNTGSFGATINLGSFASGAAGAYNDYTIFITSGVGAGQQGVITAYDGSTHIATVNVTTAGTNLLWSTLPTASGFTLNWKEAVPLLGSDPVSGGGLSLYSDAPNQGFWNNPTNQTATVQFFPNNSAAQSLTITSVSPTTGVTLQWVDQGVSELWYEVQRSTDNTNWTTIGTTSMNIGTVFTDLTATNAFNSSTVSYFYRVRGVNFDANGVFSSAVDTNHNVLIGAPTINGVVQGKPGTAGLIISGGSVNSAGIDIQYAPVTAGNTGSFIDATPLPLPPSTFDYQVTGLTASQQYVFKVGNKLNNPATTFFSGTTAFTPSGGVTEIFGAPGTITSGPGANGGFSTAGDLLRNGSPAPTLTGAGTPSTPTASGTLNTAITADLANPTSPAGITSSADVPLPSVAGTLSTHPQNSALSNAPSYFLEYTWVSNAGETLPLQPAQGLTNTGWGPNTRVGVGVTYSIPSTAPAGAVNANVYIGTSTNNADEVLAGNIAIGGTLAINTPPTGKNPPTISGTGMPPGTYFVEYTWINGSNQETAASTEQTVTVSNPSNDITVTLPTAPNNGVINLATRANIYIGTSSGGEHLSGTQNVSGALGAATAPPLLIRGLPATSAATPPSSNQAGVASGTYFMQYSWVSSEPSQNQSGEGLTNALQTITVSGANKDIGVQLPVLPAGAGSTNVYLGYQIPNPGSAAAVVVGTTGGSLAAGTYFINYEWFENNAAANTLPSTAEQSVVVAANGSIKVAPPNIPFGASGSKIFVGTASGQEKFAGTLTGGVGAQPTFTINSLPSSSAASLDGTNTSGQVALTRVASGGGTAVTTLFLQQLALGGTLAPISSPATGSLGLSSQPDLVNPTAAATIVDHPFGDSTSSLFAGVYYVQYTWLGTNGGETAASPEQTFTLAPQGTSPAMDVTLPAAPTGAGNGNIYIGTTPGGEQLSQQAVGGNLVEIKSLPATNAKAAPVASTIGLAPGTYYVAFTWTSGNGLETAGSTEQTVTVTNPTNDLIVTIPTAPVGAGAARVYLGTAPGQEYFAGSANGGSSLTIVSLPNKNSRIVPTTNATTLRYYTPANSLQLNSNNNGQTSTSYNVGEDISNGFSTSFDFALTGTMSADGIAFVIQDQAQNTVGGGGGGWGLTGTNHSVAVVFETFTGSGNLNATALSVNGNSSPTFFNLGTNPANGQPTGVQYSNGNSQDQRIGDIFNVSLTYNNQTHILTETVTDTTLAARGVPNQFVQTYSIDIAATIGMPAGYVGFTAASGGDRSEKDILNWQFFPQFGLRTQLDTVTGTAGVDTITLKKDTDGQTIDWTISGDTNTYFLNINDPNGLTINGLGGADIINLDYTNGNPLPNGMHLNSGSTAFPPAGQFTINGLQGATPLAGTTVDINRSTVFINYSSPANEAGTVALIKQYLSTGYNSGAWNGTSANGVITSAAAAGNVNHNTAIGWADSGDGSGVNLTANSIELKYTLNGDTNLNGATDIFDLNNLLPHFNGSGDWTSGDSTYNGLVDIFDLNALLPNFNTNLGSQVQSATTSASVAPATTSASSDSTSTSANSSLANGTTSGTLSTGSSASSVNAAASVSSSNDNNSKKPNKKNGKNK
jgi:hypothetical protein